MSCNEELQGYYRINKQAEFNKVIKAMVDAANKHIDAMNNVLKAYKKTTRNRTSMDWNKFESLIPQVRVGSGWSYRTAPAFSLDWQARRMIEHGLSKRGNIAKITKQTLRVDSMSINLASQSFEIDVYYDNHTVERFNEQPAVQAFWKALRQVKWQQRGAKDGGYCTYNCEYQDSENYQDYFGRVGKDMRAWVLKRPF
jgi:hypothetical protein